MDQASAARLVAALDLELGRRQAKRDAAEEQRWREQHGDDPVVLFALTADRLATRLEEAPATTVAVMSDDDVILWRRVEELGDRIGEMADRLRSRLDHEEAQAAGAPRRAPVYLGPKRERMPYGESRPASGKGRDSDKHTKKSRTEIWAEKQAEEAKARQALLPPRLAQAALQQTEFWRRGLVEVFDSRASLGVVKFAGLDGFSEAPVLPAVFWSSGLTTLSPGLSVDCKLRRNSDGSVVVMELRMASGTDPQVSPAEDRYRIQLGMGKYH